MPLIKQLLIAIISPLIEKGPSLDRASSALDSAIILSMKRIIVLFMAIIVAQTVTHLGVTTWPMATVVIATICALPMLAVLERADPEFTKALVERLLKQVVDGAAIAASRALDAMRPSKFDDHRSDESSVASAPSLAPAGA